MIRFNPTRNARRADKTRNYAYAQHILKMLDAKTRVDAPPVVEPLLPLVPTPSGEIRYGLTLREYLLLRRGLVAVIAKSVGVTQDTVWQWARRKVIVPRYCQVDITRITNQQVTIF